MSNKSEATWHPNDSSIDFNSALKSALPGTTVRAWYFTESEGRKEVVAVVDSNGLWRAVYLNPRLGTWTHTTTPLKELQDAKVVYLP